MPWYIGSETQARAVMARVNTALGLPRTPGVADRRGKGRHARFVDARTLVWSRLARLSDGRFGVRIKAVILARLTAAQRSLVVDALPVGVTITQETES